MIYKIIDHNLQESHVVGASSKQGNVKEITMSEEFMGKGLHNDLTAFEITIKTDLCTINKIYGQGITIYRTEVEK